MPSRTFVPIPPEEEAQRLGVLRRARYSCWPAFHILLLHAAGRMPTDIAAGLFCSRSSVCRTRRADRAGTLGLEHDDRGWLLPPVRTTMLWPMRRRSLVALGILFVLSSQRIEDFKQGVLKSAGSHLHLRVNHPCGWRLTSTWQRVVEQVTSRRSCRICTSITRCIGVRSTSHSSMSDWPSLKDRPLICKCA